MPVAAALAPHPAPSRHTGIIHFRGQCAYLANAGRTGWSLLQFDNSVSDVPDPTAAAATASKLQNSHNESDPVILHGVLRDQSFGVVPFSVLFLC
jgi:hypothetical protein